jgi:hypothetical protein
MNQDQMKKYVLYSILNDIDEELHRHSQFRHQLEEIFDVNNLFEVVCDVNEKEQNEVLFHLNPPRRIKLNNFPEKKDRFFLPSFD